MRKKKKIIEEKSFTVYPPKVIDSYQNEEILQLSYFIVDSYFEKKNIYIHDSGDVFKCIILPSFVNALFQKQQITNLLVVAKKESLEDLLNDFKVFPKTLSIFHLKSFVQKKKKEQNNKLNIIWTTFEDIENQIFDNFVVDLVIQELNEMELYSNVLTLKLLQTDQIIFYDCFQRKNEPYRAVKTCLKSFKTYFKLIKLKQAFSQKFKEPKHELAISNIIIPDTKFQIQERLDAPQDNDIYNKIENSLIQANISFKDISRIDEMKNYQLKNLSGKVKLLMEFILRFKNNNLQFQENKNDRVLIITHLNIYNKLLQEMFIRLNIQFKNLVKLHQNKETNIWQSELNNKYKRILKQNKTQIYLLSIANMDNKNEKKFEQIIQQFTRIIIFDQGNNFSNMTWLIDAITSDKNQKQNQMIALFNFIQKNSLENIFLKGYYIQNLLIFQGSYLKEIFYFHSKLIEYHDDYQENENLELIQTMFKNDKIQKQEVNELCFTQAGKILYEWPGDLDSEKDERFLTIAEELIQEDFKIQIITVDVSEIYQNEDEDEDNQQNNSQNEIEESQQQQQEEEQNGDTESTKISQFENQIMKNQMKKSKESEEKKIDEGSTNEEKYGPAIQNEEKKSEEELHDDDNQPQQQKEQELEQEQEQQEEQILLQKTTNPAQNSQQAPKQKKKKYKYMDYLTNLLNQSRQKIITIPEKDYAQYKLCNINNQERFQFLKFSLSFPLYHKKPDQLFQQLKKFHPVTNFILKNKQQSFMQYLKIFLGLLLHPEDSSNIKLNKFVFFDLKPIDVTKRIIGLELMRKAKKRFGKNEQDFFIKTNQYQELFNQQTNQ